MTLTLAASLDSPLPSRIDEVRRSVMHAAEHTIGLQVTAVDVTVTDILEPSPAPGTTKAGQHPPSGV
ncbi:hypothetical protein ACIRU3_46935 [Streptomyces sp. NPDC101151]|uniref:hypothetical protein n=1 Tax=Streptomyces sp. NPDC101151 TaxID=3366115 RepID=UPI0038202171